METTSITAAVFLNIDDEQSQSAVILRHNAAGSPSCHVSSIENDLTVSSWSDLVLTIGVKFTVLFIVYDHLNSFNNVLRSSHMLIFFPMIHACSEILIFMCSFPNVLYMFMTGCSVWHFFYRQSSLLTRYSIT